MRGAAWVQGDVAAIGRDAPSGLAPSAVVHAAGITTAACERDPDAAYRVNVEGTRPSSPGAGACRSRRASSSPFCRGLRRRRNARRRAKPRLPTLDLRRDQGGRRTARARCGPARRDRRCCRSPADHDHPDQPRWQTRAGYLSDLALHACAGRPFEAPLGADHVLPVASSAATFALLARLADPALSRCRPRLSMYHRSQPAAPRW